MKIKTTLLSSAVLASLAAQPLYADDPVFVNGKWFHNHEVNDTTNVLPFDEETAKELLAKGKNLALVTHPTDVINLDLDSDGFIDEGANFDGVIDQRLYDLLLSKCMTDTQCLDRFEFAGPDNPTDGNGTVIPDGDEAINIGDGGFQDFFMMYWDAYYQADYSHKNGWKEFMKLVHNDWQAYQTAIKERELENTPDIELLKELKGYHHHTFSQEYIEAQEKKYRNEWKNMPWWQFWSYFYYWDEDEYWDYWGKKHQKHWSKGYWHNHQHDHFDPEDQHHLAEHAEDLKELRTVEDKYRSWKDHAWSGFFETSFKHPYRVVTWKEKWNRHEDFGDAAVWNQWHLDKMSGEEKPKKGPKKGRDHKWDDDKWDDDKWKHKSDDDWKWNNGWHNGWGDEKWHNDWKHDHKHKDHDHKHDRDHNDWDEKDDKKQSNKGKWKKHDD